MKSPARDLLDRPPYSMSQSEKRDALLPMLESLTRHHFAACAPYRRIVEAVFGGLPKRFERLEDLPYIPVSLFKSHELFSVPREEVFKVLTSSGTTGQRVSRVVLDRETSEVQSAVLVRVAQHFLGKERLPMVIVDHPGVVSDRSTFSARGAGILGLAQFGHRPFYALRPDMTLDIEGLETYLAETRGRRVLVFGFTWMIWAFLLDTLERANRTFDLSNGILIHSGGWKKLEERAVRPEDFRSRVTRWTGIRQVINFYGMVEQVGSVYFENERHALHAPIYSDVIVRDPVTLAPVSDGETGLLQLLSCLPASYPGHSLLTEDLGRIVGTDLPGLAMKGRCFEVLGRVPAAELRGCSDTFQERAA